jgi:UDP-glucose 4-epimerase
MRVALTGASGQVGRFLVADLLARGCSVSAWTRGRALPPEVAPIPGDLDDRESMRALCRGADLLIHAAFDHLPGRYRGGEGDDREGFVRRNLHGSLALLRTARALGVGRAVVLSSRAVLDGCPPGRHDERMAPRPTTLYGEVKAALEAFVEATGRHWPVTALRATGVYGVTTPLEASKWFALLSDARSGRLPDADRSGSEVHGADLADAVWRLSTAPEAGGRVYNCSDLVVRSSDVLRLAGIEAALPAAEPPAVVLDTMRLRALGWRPGGHARLRATVDALTAAGSARRSAGVAR